VSLHPDVLLVERGLYPPALLGGKSEATGISVEQVRTIVLPRLGFAPHEGRALVVLIRDADELTTSAANALLKTLEEPPPRTHFILLTTRPGRLLDTIRSRTLPVRFGPLPLAALTGLLEREGLPTEVATHAGGSLERARLLAEPEARARRDAFVHAADLAILADHDQAALDFADERPEGRSELLEVLAHLSTVYAERARAGEDLYRFARYHEAVQRSLADVESNASPALAVETLLLRLRGLYRGAPLPPRD
jgi:DNA polymerase-3 subunit delta'